MRKLKEIFKQLLREFLPADSVWSRGAATSADKHRKKGANKQQANGATIAKKMEFDDEGHRSIYDVGIDSAMDAAFREWQKKQEKKKDKK